MIDTRNTRLSIGAQCRLMDIPRSSFYYRPAGTSREDERLMRLIDRQYLATPFYGSRRMSGELRLAGFVVNRKRVQRLMAQMGLSCVYPRPRTSKPHPEHRVYPYLLRNLEVIQPGAVWCADITYLPLARGFCYLAAVIGLGQPAGAFLPGLEHPGCLVWHCGPPGGFGALSRPADHEHPPGSPVHLGSLYQPAPGP